MSSDRAIFIKCLLILAMGSFDLEYPDDEQNFAQALADYLTCVIARAAKDWESFNVIPVAYPASSKIPLLVTYAGVNSRLFWYHLCWSDVELADNLADILLELLEGEKIMACAEDGDLCVLPTA